MEQYELETLELRKLSSMRVSNRIIPPPSNKPLCSACPSNFSACRQINNPRAIIASLAIKHNI